ncbi:hypothetical protein [Halalkalibacillus halophilus]|uniref:hypothetical protein n=1 Tax=Halalkalibacillus halophilus TaxID=392827 RepID=UPI000417185C|nr:hypothetical protein [Halalkalibacillus halophilus]
MDILLWLLIGFFILAFTLIVLVNAFSERFGSSNQQSRNLRNAGKKRLKYVEKKSN